MTVGQAANPPTKTVDLSLTVEGLTSARSARKHKAKPKITTLATARISIPSGAKRPLKLKLGKTGNALLKRYHTLVATLTIHVTGTDGTKAQTTRKLTLKAPRRHG